MRLADYGETVKGEIYNLLWQKEEEKDFDTLAEAWEWVKDEIDCAMIKLHVKAENRRPLQLRVWKDFERDRYIVQPNWDMAKSVSDPGKIYGIMADLIVEQDG